MDILCDCHSPTFTSAGTTPAVIFIPPAHWHSGKTGIAIDACIAPVIQHLWDNGVVTRSCCCGHNIQPPSIILEDNLTARDAAVVRKIIAEVDRRNFILYSWQTELVEL